MPIEKIDIYDESMKHVGVSTRGEALDKGYWQKSIHVWILTEIEGESSIIFQLRSPNKKVFPDKLDISAAGHLIAGEKPEEGIREIKEELGLDIQYNDLVKMGIRTEVVKIGDKIVREFCDTYMLPLQADFSDFKLGVEEVSALVAVTVKDGLDLFSGNVNSINGKGIRIDSKGVTHSIKQIVTVDNVIPRLDRFYFKVFLMAELYLKGQRFLAI